MPSALHQLVGSVTDTYTVVAEHPRPGDIRPSVWEVNGPGVERWFAKQHVGDRLHQREVDAYQQWTRALGTDRAPFLAACNSKERAVVVTAVPGSSLDKLRLPAEQEREAYRQAGLLLARQHTADPSQPPTAAAETGWDEKLAKLLDGAARFLTADEIAMLHSLAEQAPAVLPKVVAHGDYMPKNWMWDESEQRLRIIDFERTQHEPAARRDLSRLHYRVLHHRPDLAAAFYSGYGRPLSCEEKQARTTYAALDALDSVCWGATHHDIDLVDEAHTMIANLRTECTRRSVGW